MGAVSVLLMVVALGCAKTEQENAQSKSEKARDEFVKSAQDTVDSLEANMNKLGALASAKGAEAKAKYDADVKPALDRKLDQAKATLAKVKAQSSLAWEDTKDAAQSAVDGLKDAYNDAVKMFQ